jgi:dihydrofolate reductase
MTTVVTAHSTSLDGLIAGAGDSHKLPLGGGGDRLFEWLSEGDTPSRYNPGFKMSALSAAFFDEGVDRVDAVIAGRRTYDVSEAWGGSGPMPGIPLFVVTHRVPESVPAGDPPYTFVTEGIQRAVERPRLAAAGRDVFVMAAQLVQQCLRAGLLDELVINLVPVVLGSGVRLLEGLQPGSVELDLVRVVDARRHAPDLPSQEVAQSRHARRPDQRRSREEHQQQKNPQRETITHTRRRVHQTRDAPATRRERRRGRLVLG